MPSDAISGADFFVNVLAGDPGVAVYGVDFALNAGEAAFDSARAAVAEVPELCGAAIEATGDAAATGFQCAGDLAGTVFETVAEIIAGIFS